MKKNLISHYGIPEEKITTVGTGLGVIQPFFGVKDYHQKKILFTAKGRFKDKGGDLMIAAFEHALKIDPEIQLTIVGCEDGLRFKPMKNLTTLGFISLPELQELFNSHSLFVMPARNEPWGLVYIEAMLCKMPILGLNRNSFPELCGYGKYGFGIDEADPELVGAEMAEAVSRPENLEAIGLAAQKHTLEYFTWDNTIERILGKIFN